MSRNAVDEGLSACYLGIVPEAVDQVRAASGIPDDHEPIGAVAIGYDAEPAKPNYSRRRRSIAEMVHYGNW